MINKTLEARGRAERVDHRSYKRPGVDRKPGCHYGPGALRFVAHGQEHDRLEEALRIYERERQRQDLDREIAQVEALRASIVRDGLPDDRLDEPRDYSHSWRPTVSYHVPRGR